MNPKALTRQWDIIPRHILETPITIIGAGAIGSHTAKALAQTGFNDLTVWDDDKVEIENMNAQGYRLADIGRPKVEALLEIIESHVGPGSGFTPRNARYEKGVFPGLVIAAVDNMKTRKVLWEEHKKAGVHTAFIIDPRMGAETALLYTMSPMEPKDRESYEKTLYADEDSLMEPCTRKATIYTALLLSGMVCKAVKDVLTKDTENYPRVMAWDIRENDFSLWSKAPVEAKSA